MSPSAMVPLFVLLLVFFFAKQADLDVVINKCKGKTCLQGEKCSGQEDPLPVIPFTHTCMCVCFVLCKQCSVVHHRGFHRETWMCIRGKLNHPRSTPGEIGVQQNEVRQGREIKVGSAVSWSFASIPVPVQWAANWLQHPWLL